MRTPRLILAALLLATPLLLAQEAGTQKTEAKAAAAQGVAQCQAAPSPPDEAFRITITFKNTEGGKTTTQRSYMLAVTIRQDQDYARDLGIRDDSHFSGTADSSGLSLPFAKTDVDLARFKRTGNSAYLNLIISTDDFVDNPAEHTHPIIRSRHYNISPMLPIGKLVTVYSAVDAVNDAKVDIQVLVQPFDAK
jgi:hypothetical protein